jgi:hypothetical protein
MSEPGHRQPTGPFVYISLLVGFGVAMWAVKPFWDAAGHDSRRAECTVNLEIVADQESAITKAEGRPLPCDSWPTAPPGPEGTPWTDVPVCWQRLGMEPGVTLHGQYKVETSTTGWTATCIVAIGDEIETWKATDSVTTYRVGG